MICNAWWFFIFVLLFVCFTQDLVELKDSYRTQSSICVFYPNNVLRQLIKVWNQILTYKVLLKLFEKEKGLILKEEIQFLI
jgi:hypothetical protein